MPACFSSIVASVLGSACSEGGVGGADNLGCSFTADGLSGSSCSMSPISENEMAELLMESNCGFSASDEAGDVSSPLSSPSLSLPDG